MGRTTVVIDAANDPRLARDLTAGGAFVTGYELAISEECDLVVHNGGAQIKLAARVVYVNPVDVKQGAGLEVVGFGASLRDQLARVIDGSAEGGAGFAAPEHLDGDDSIPLAVPTAAGSEPSVPVAAASLEAARRRVKHASIMSAPTGSNPDLPRVTLAQGSSVDVRDAEPEDGPEADARRVAADPVQASIHSRIRGMTLAEQVKLALVGDIAERIVLERMYGKNVWEPLLRNPRLTAPEVARISRMGALPRVLIEIIVANGAWLAIPDVRRALLTNPRLGTDQILKVLKLMPKVELRLVPTQTALPIAVRECAKKMLRGEM